MDERKLGKTDKWAKYYPHTNVIQDCGPFFAGGMRFVYKSDGLRLFSADSSEYFPRPGVPCCAPCDPIVVQSAEEKYRNTEIQDDSKYRKSAIPLATCLIAPRQ